MENRELLLKILKNTEDLKTRINNVETDFNSRFLNIESRLDGIEKTHGERLQNIENIVTRMEKEHGEKIQVLFDYFVDQDSKNKEINSKIDELFKKSDEHDTRIFTLEFYKAEKLTSK